MKQNNSKRPQNKYFFHLVSHGKIHDSFCLLDAIKEPLSEAKMVLQLSLLEIILEKHAGGICHSSLCVSTKQKKTFSMIIFLIKRENVKDLMMWVTKRSVLIFIYLFSSRSAQKCFQRYATFFSVPSFVNIEELWECNVYVCGERTITVHQMHFHIFVNKTFGANNCLSIKIHMICILL